VKAPELKLAKALVESLAGDFKPKQYTDTYRENLEKLIAAKAKGKEIEAVAEPKPAKVLDIMEALRNSLAEKKAVKSSGHKKRARGKAA